jgi:hypothetical protein
VKTHHSTGHPRIPNGTIGTALIFIAVFVSILAWGLIHSRAAETATVPDTISLSEYNRTAGSVTFIHKDHGSTGSDKPGCSDCHHTTARDQILPKCSVCHGPFDNTDAPTDTVAFHLLCIGCHKSEIESGNRRIDLACDYCHMPER